MTPRFRSFPLGSALALALLTHVVDARAFDNSSSPASRHSGLNVQVGVRPYYLVDHLPNGPLKRELEACSEKPIERTRFSISHRGAPLQFPEHTKESYEAAHRQGAGIIECDVTFTNDLELVCRHDQCDLHTTTNILTIPELAAKCTQPFTPANASTPASAKCCTSDITLAEFKTLKGKMDGFNPKATTAQEYQKGTPDWRTEAYDATGTLLTLDEHIQLTKKWGVDATPELKAATGVTLPYKGLTQAAYAQKLIDAYKKAGVPPWRVWPQSFNIDDIYYWIQHEPAFGRQAVALITLDDPSQFPATIAALPEMRRKGVQIVAPAYWALLALDAQKRIVPSQYARVAKQLGFDIITWSLERSGPLTKPRSKDDEYYYQSVADVITGPEGYYQMLDVLTRKVGIRGIFSDWPATVTYYANCLDLN